uniref:Delta(3,5)-Delta(2,4)-dienoyl-CoA isomerase, mitochondrial n=1 Tax=Macrostomum lignano TaxID=282301 RepID=A0A1I8FP37_9PLAT
RPNGTPAEKSYDPAKLNRPSETSLKSWPEPRTPHRSSHAERERHHRLDGSFNSVLRPSPPPHVRALAAQRIPVGDTCAPVPAAPCPTRPRVWASSHHVRVTQPSEFVRHIVLCRPDRLNSMTWAFFDTKIGRCFDAIAKIPTVGLRCCQLKASILRPDLTWSMRRQMLGGSNPDQDPARKAAEIRRTLFRLQAGLSALERCSKPVIAAIHGGCIGGGVDLVAAADIRYCSSDAFFSAEEAQPGVGLVSRVLDDRDRLLAAALSLASDIAAKRPGGCSRPPNGPYCGGPRSSGGPKIAAENAAMLQSEDVARAVAASL